MRSDSVYLEFWTSGSDVCYYSLRPINDLSLKQGRVFLG